MPAQSFGLDVCLCRLLDNHAGRQSLGISRTANVDVLGEDDSVNTIQAIGVGQVGGDLRLRIDPSAIELVVENHDRAGLDRKLDAEADSSDVSIKNACESSSGDIHASEEFFHHSEGGRSDIEGEAESTGSDSSGDQVTLLVENLVGVDVLTFPRSGILDNLAERLRLSEVGKALAGVVGDRAEYNQVALSCEKFRGVFKFRNSHSFYEVLIKLFVVCHFKFKVVTEYPEVWFGDVGVMNLSTSYS